MKFLRVPSLLMVGLWAMVLIPSLGRAQARTCQQLFQYKPYTARYAPDVSHVELQPPVRQCLGTCYIEQAIVSLRYAYQRELIRERGEESPDSTLSRAHMLASYVRELLDSYFKDPLTLALSKPPAMDPSAPTGIFDVLSMGNSLGVIKHLANKPIPLTRPLSPAETRQQDQRVEQLYKDILRPLKEARRAYFQEMESRAPEARELIEQMERELSREFYTEERPPITVLDKKTNQNEQIRPVEFFNGHIFPRNVEHYWWNTAIEGAHLHAKYLQAQVILFGVNGAQHRKQIAENDLRVVRGFLDQLERMLEESAQAVSQQMKLQYERVDEAFEEFLRQEQQYVLVGDNNPVKTLDPGWIDRTMSNAQMATFRNELVNVENLETLKTGMDLQQLIKGYLEKYGTVSMTYESVMDFFSVENHRGAYDVPRGGAEEVRRVFLNPHHKFSHIATIVGLHLDSKGRIEFLDIQQMDGYDYGPRGTNQMSWDYFLHFAQAVYGF